MATIAWNSYPALTSGAWWGCLHTGAELFAWEETWTSGQAGSIVYSTDIGASWTFPGGAVVDGFSAWAAAFNGTDTVVFVGNGVPSGTGLEMYYRVAGVWSEGAMPSAATVWHGVAWNGNTFCAVRETGSATAPDGFTWSGSARSFGELPVIMAHGATFLVVTETDGFVFRSINDGASFSQIAMPSVGWEALAHNGAGRVVAVGFDKVAYSNDDGLNWTEVALTGDWQQIAWNGAMFCAVANSGSMYATSTDGISWDTPTALPGGTFPVGAYMTAYAGDFYFNNYNSLFTDAVPGGGPVHSPFFLFS